MSESKEKSLKKSIQNLKETIETRREEAKDTTLSDFIADKNYEETDFNVRIRRTLKGHLSKIYSFHWSEDSKLIVSASQDGKLLVWNAMTTNKIHAVAVNSPWTMTCAFSPSGRFVACGGLNNVCSVFDLETNDNTSNTPRPTREFNGHTGMVSGCRFLSDREILTSSGDKTCALWDIETGAKVREFLGHERDVMSLSLYHDNSKFVSGGCDKKAIFWDIKAPKPQLIFDGHHKADINSLDFVPNGESFVTGSDDSTCVLFDVRSYSDLMTYQCPSATEDVNQNTAQGISSVCLSSSGKYLFAGHDDNNCHVFDTLTGNLLSSLLHGDRVTCVGVSRDGTALCTSSWDAKLRIWA